MRKNNMSEDNKSFTKGEMWAMIVSFVFVVCLIIYAGITEPKKTYYPPTNNSYTPPAKHYGYTPEEADQIQKNLHDPEYIKKVERYR
jgi:cell division protein FtsN